MGTSHPDVCAQTAAELTPGAAPEGLVMGLRDQWYGARSCHLHVPGPVPAMYRQRMLQAGNADDLHQ